MKEIFGDDCFRVLDDDKLVLFYFSATWCRPCKKFTPLMEQISEKINNVNFYKIMIDNDENEEICEKFKIESVPTVFLLKNRNSLGSVSGANINNVLLLIKKNLK